MWYDRLQSGMLVTVGSSKIYTDSLMPGCFFWSPWVRCLCHGQTSRDLLTSLDRMHNFEQRMASAVDDTNTKGWLVSILELGAWFGVLVSGFLTDKLSRKYTILLGMWVTSERVRTKMMKCAHSRYRVLHWRHCTNRRLPAVIHLRRSVRLLSI